MKLIDHFETFLADVVNLNKTRFDLLESSIESIKNVIRASDWGPSLTRFVPQGSWAHRTIIRPVEGKEFDADLLAVVDHKDGWDAKEYVNELHRVFDEHKTYTDKVKKHSFCVTIEYAQERRIDIAPCIINRDGTGRFEVCNRVKNQFHLSEPEAYTNWLVLRNKWTGGNGLRKVTRLLKYLRDIKGNFSCPSILFTTLLGACVVEEDESNTEDFADLPTGLKTIIGRLDDFLQSNPERPEIRNPALETETFEELLSDTQYRNFRAKINTYRRWIDDAYSEENRYESIGKWRLVFGEDFAKSVAIEKAATVSDMAVARFKRSDSAVAMAVSGDLVSLFERYGNDALPPDFDLLPHKERPWWSILPRPPFQVGVKASLHARHGGERIRLLGDERSSLPKRHWLQFWPYTSDGTALTLGYEIFWRVTNTDRAAHAARCLRGKIIKASEGFYHWEHLEYRGVHSVEAFVVQKSDHVLAAKSRPFYVVIA